MIVRTVAFCTRRPWPVVALAALVAIVSAVYAATDEAVIESFTQLNNDIQLPPNAGGLAGYAQSFDPHFVPKWAAMAGSGCWPTRRATPWRKNIFQ